MHIPVCKYRLDGISLIQKDIYKKEAKRCIKENFKIGYLIYWCFEALRESKFFSKVLHMVYKLLYIRKA
jgi:hypothetical protein